jgi:hypothetical protein
LWTLWTRWTLWTLWTRWTLWIEHSPLRLLPPAPCTLHPAPCTLHPAPCTLHPAPCTLHPASVIQQEKTKGTTTTGTVAPLFKPHAVPSFKATPHRKFRTTITQNLVFCERFSKNRCASYWL